MIDYICVRFIHIVTFHIHQSLDWYWIKETYLCICKCRSWRDSQQKEVFLFSEAPRPALSLHPAPYPVAAWIRGVKLLYTFNSHTVCLNLMHWDNLNIGICLLGLREIMKTIRSYWQDNKSPGLFHISSVYHYTWLQLNYKNFLLPTHLCGFFPSGFHLNIGMHISFLPCIQHSHTVVNLNGWREGCSPAI